MRRKRPYLMRDTVFRAPMYSYQMPIWLADAPERAFIIDFMKAAPERLHVYNPWPVEYIDRAFFPCLQVAANRSARILAEIKRNESTWKKYGQRLEQLFAKAGEAAVGEMSLPIDVMRVECERLEVILEEGERAFRRAQRFETELEWFCRAQAELICARLEADGPDVADRERALAWVKDCERYLQILTVCWRPETDRVWLEDRTQAFLYLRDKLDLAPRSTGRPITLAEIRDRIKSMK